MVAIQGGEVAEAGEEDAEEEAEQVGRVAGGRRQVRTSSLCKSLNFFKAKMKHY